MEELVKAIADARADENEPARIYASGSLYDSLSEEFSFVAADVAGEGETVEPHDDLTYFDGIPIEKDDDLPNGEFRLKTDEEV